MSRDLIKGFENPHPDYRPVTMWFWNDELCEREITAQMEAFKAKGVNEFFVHTAGGSMDEYLGERFWQMIRYTVDEAKRIGLAFWIYDEIDWPSGVAGGKVIKEHPEFKAKGIVHERKNLAPNEKINNMYFKGSFAGARITCCDRPEDGTVDVTDEVEVEENKYGYWLSYSNNRCGDVVLQIMSYDIDNLVTPAGKSGKYATWEVGYIDSLKEDAIRAFIDSTHEKYKEVVGDEFGKTVKGVFTDEIQIGYVLWGNRTPWNEQLKDKFIARFGYDFTPWMHALIEVPTTLQEKKVRYHYWILLTELMLDAHVKQVYDWCEKENIKYTGHFPGEEWMLWFMNRCGEMFELFKYQHIPGIDSIYSRKFIYDEDFDVAGKMGASCARFYDRDRLLCETYTISSTKFRYDEMRRIANRLLVLGVNMIQYMGSHYSLEHARKGHTELFGPSFGDNDPMFTRRDTFGDYISRIQYISAQTKPCGKVLLMCPQTAVYVNTDYHHDTTEYDKDFTVYPDPTVFHYDEMNIAIVNALLDTNVEFDMFSDYAAKEVTAKDGIAAFYGCEYDIVIMHYTGETTRAVLDMIERLKTAGVKMVFINELPWLAVDEAEYVSPLGKTPDRDGVIRIDDNINFFRFTDTAKLKRKNSTAFKNILLEALDGAERTLDIRHDGNIYTGLRSNGKDTVVFMCNDTAEERHASIAYKEGMQLLDPDTCRSIKLDPVGGRAAITFGAFQMYVLIQSDEKVDWQQEETLLVKSEPMLTLQNCCELELEKDNVLEADWKYAHVYCNADEPVVVPENELTDTNYGKVPTRYALANEPGLLVFDFDAVDIPKKVELFIECRDILRCELNGVRIDKNWQSCRLWGPHCASLDVTALLKKGGNRLTAAFALPDCVMNYEAAFAMFRGCFETDGRSIRARRRSYAAAPVNEQGAPNFYGNAVYGFTVNLTAKEAEEAAFLTVDTREATELFVNGVSVGTRLWHPQKFNVSGKLKAGENKLSVKVTMPMWNLFGDKNEKLYMGLLSAPVIEKLSR